MTVASQGSLEQAVSAALPAGADAGAAELARAYARHIDQGGELEKVGPLLLAVLESLLLTPRARSLALKGARDESAVSSPIDEVRARREARIRRTETPDATAT